MFGRRTGAGAGGDGDGNPNEVDGRHHVGARIIQAPARVACNLGLGFKVMAAADSSDTEQPAVSRAGSTRLVAEGMAAASAGAVDMSPTLQDRQQHDCDLHAQCETPQPHSDACKAQAQRRNCLLTSPHDPGDLDEPGALQDREVATSACRQQRLWAPYLQREAR